MDHLCDSEQAASKLRFMTLVKNCATRLLDLVVNIMEMASMVSAKDASKNQQKLSHDPVELTKIVDEIVMLVKSSTDKSGKPLLKKEVELINEVTDMPIIEADAHKCTQVFYNLVTNACKFTKSGSIVISSHLDPNKEWVEVAIADTGSGIAAESLERIFQPFEQEDNSNVRGYQGIGLGLAIAHEVVQRHGGNIKVESTLEVGTTFTVRLPVVMADNSAGDTLPKVEGSCEGTLAHTANLETCPEVEVEEATEAPQLEMSSASRKPVLLSVDDDTVNQEVLRKNLADEFEIHEAMGGQQALDYLEQCKVLPSAMLLDIMMPGVSGLDVCRIVRNKMGLSPTVLPILVVSATSVSSCIIEAFDSGCNDFVSKPFDKQVLKSHVRAVLRLKECHEEEVARAARAKSRVDSANFASKGSTDSEGGDPEPTLRRRR